MSIVIEKDKIILQRIRQEIDRMFIGFVPMGSSVKPVHISVGALKYIYGKAYDVNYISKLSYVMDAKGQELINNKSEDIYNKLISDGIIDGTELTEDLIKSFRLMLQDIIGADGGVFGIKSMIAYTVPSKYFLNTDDLYQQTGSFMGGLIKENCPTLTKIIIDSLNNKNDPISLLFGPVLNDKTAKSYDQLIHENVVAYKNGKMDNFIHSLKLCADCLSQNISNHPNKLFRLRTFNMFIIYEIIKYMSELENMYCEATKKPILLDFTNNITSSVAHASTACFTNINQSLSRVYTWFFKQCLEDETNGLSIDDLFTSNTPVYKENDKHENNKVMNELWNIAKEDAQNANCEEDKYSIFANQLYDMLALESSSNPIIYLRSLGTKMGILYPPTNYPNKRFALTSEILEMLLQCCIEKCEVITLLELQNRLYNRFNIIIGGRNEDEEILHEAGILFIDSDSLKVNSDLFASSLKNMNIAEIKADGILQIKMEENN